MKTFKIENFSKDIADYKYAFAYISTDFTNSTELAVEVDAFNDFAELYTERSMDEDIVNELKEMAVGQSAFTDCYWTIVRIK